MTYLVAQTNSRRKGGVRTAFIAGILLAVLVGGVQILWPYFFPAVFMTVARPFWRMEFSVESGSLSSPESLLAENESLKRELADATVRLQSANALMAENTELKDTLGRASTTPRILAAVLRRPPLAFHDELVIDAGMDHGFAVGDLVYAPGEVLVGYVSSVLGNTSLVTLFSSPGEKYDVEVGTTHAPATANGEGGGQYSAALPRTVPVVEGDAILVPSIESIPFATVSAVIADPSSAFQKILFAPPVNVYELRWVLVDAHAKFTPQTAKIPPLETTAPKEATKGAK